MDFVDQRVTHVRFGAGSVKNREGNVIQICFQEYGDRAFKYPEAFDKFLVAHDKAFAKAVLKDLSASRNAHQTASAERLNAIYEAASNAKKPAKKKK